MNPVKHKNKLKKVQTSLMLNSVKMLSQATSMVQEAAEISSYPRCKESKCQVAQ